MFDNAEQRKSSVLVWREKGNDTMLVSERVTDLSQPLFFILFLFSDSCRDFLRHFHGANHFAGFIG